MYNFILRTYKITLANKYIPNYLFRAPSKYSYLGNENWKF